MLHKCTDKDCPFSGQKTNRSCGCHQTDEQVLREDNERLRAALKTIGYDFYPSNKSEESLALSEIREFALSSI